MEFKHTPAEARQLWLVALKSGNFRQCEGRLYDGEGHCCLGVACELFMLHEPEQGMWKVEPHLATANDGRWKYRVQGYESGGVLPDIVQQWLGMKTSDGLLRQIGGRSSSEDENLTSANDEGKSFAEIAAIIEANEQVLFLAPTAAQSCGKIA